MLAVQKSIVRQSALLGVLFSCQPAICLSHVYLPRTVFKSQSVITVMSVLYPGPSRYFYWVRSPYSAVRSPCFLLIAVVLLFAFCLPSVLPEFDQSNRTISLFSQICDLKLMLKLLQIAWPTVASLWTGNELRKIGMGSTTGFLERGSEKGLTDNWHLVKI